MATFPIFEQWREAQRAAIAAELVLYRAQLAHCADRAAAPDPELVHHTRMLQAHARGLFTAAMSELEAASRAARP